MTKPPRKSSIRPGDKFGALTAIKRVGDHIAPSGNCKPQWECVCSCGRHIIVQQMLLKQGRKEHCGCQRLRGINTHLPGNTYDLSGNYGIGYTRKGEEFWFDLADADTVKSYTWSFAKDGNLKTNTKVGNTAHTPFLHQVLMGPPPPGMVVSHINRPAGNGCKMDYRRQNLQFVSVQQRNHDKAMRQDNTSGHTGIRKIGNSWVAKIRRHGKQYQKHFPLDQLDAAIQWRADMEVQLQNDVCDPTDIS